MMKKRVVSGVAALVLALSGGGMAFGNVVDLNFDVTASAADYENDDYRYTIESGGIAIKDYIGDSTNVIIPSEIDGLPVIKLCAGSFYRKDIDSVVIPDSVKKFEDSDYGKDGVFEGCPTLKSVVMPNSMDKIGTYAFYKCLSLESIVIPKTVTKIDRYSFSGCSKLSSLTLSEGLIYIEEGAFSNCPSLKTICIPKSVQSFGHSAIGYNDGNVMKNFTLQCYRNSKAQLYAIDHNINYELITSITKVNPDVTATAGTGSAELEWNAVSNAQKYAVCGYTNGAWKILAETTDSSYTLKGLTAGKNYQVAVIAMFDGEWYEDYSKAVTVTPAEPVVTNVFPELVSVNISKKTHKIKIEWEAVSGAERYCLAAYVSGKWKVKAYASADTTEMTTPQLTPGTVYTFAVCAKKNGKWDTSKIKERAFQVIAL